MAQDWWQLPLPGAEVAYLRRWTQPFRSLRDLERERAESQPPGPQPTDDHTAQSQER